jgi:hypothetical protein
MLNPMLLLGLADNWLEFQALDREQSPFDKPLNPTSDSGKDHNSYPCTTNFTGTAPVNFDSVRFRRKFIQNRIIYIKSAINPDGMRRIRTIVNKVWDYNNSVNSLTNNLTDSEAIHFVH